MQTAGLGKTATGKVLLSHPTGNANVRQALLALYENGLLAEFWTTLCWDSQSPLNLLLPKKLRAELSRRSYPQIPPQFVHANPWREACRLLAMRAGMERLIFRNESYLSVASVCAVLDRTVANHVPRAALKAVYAYEDGALDSFRAARKEGILTFYELPIAYWKSMHELLEEEANLCPGWADTMPSSRDSAEKTDRKDSELELADLIFVPSRYVMDSLPRHLRQSGRVRICSYGAPETVSRHSRMRSAKLRVLYVGGLSQRKGLAYLVRALRCMDSVLEVTIIGRRVGNCAELDSALAHYRYIPAIPHSQVLAEMERHDVLVLPTLTEGLALVVLEAMSRGMAVVTTPNSGAADIVRDGVDGFLVPIRSSSALAEKLELLARDHELLEAVQKAAWKRAQEYSWERYRAALASAVEDALREGKLQPGKVAGCA